MNSARQWIRATRALGFALLLGTGPAWATTPVTEALATSPPFAPTRDAADATGCDAASGASMIAFSESSDQQAARDCASSSGDPAATRPPPIYQGHRFAEPAAGALLGQPIDNRRYSF